MIRVVIDTNVYVSALVFGGKPATVLQLSCALEGRAEVIVSGDRAVLMRTGWERRWGVARSGDAARTSA